MAYSFPTHCSLRPTGKSPVGLCAALFLSGALALLGGCFGGGNRIDAASVLANGSEGEEAAPAPAGPTAPVVPLPGTTREVSRAQPGAAPVAGVEPVHVQDIPRRVLGQSQLEDYVEQSAAVALQADANAFGPCRARAITMRTNVFDKAPDESVEVFRRNGAVGGYVTEIMVGGCAPPRRHNVLIVPFRDQPTAILPLLPGTTKAGVSDQSRASRIALEAAERIAVETCSGQGSARIRTTETKGPFGADRRVGAWQEQWTAHYCGRDYAVTLIFTPRSDGPTRIEAPAGLARLASIDWPLP